MEVSMLGLSLAQHVLLSANNILSEQWEESDQKKKHIIWYTLYILYFLPAVYLRARK